MTRRTLNRDALPARILTHLADNGPSTREVLEPLATGQQRTAMPMALGRLRELGFVTTKVWLTPEGLAECRRMGWRPDIAGLAEPEGAAA